MRKIVIARHGQDEDNAKGIFNGRRDMSLTTKGREEAYTLAKNLKGHSSIDIGWIFSSPLKRARETAKIVSNRLITRYSVINSLIEMSHGILEGRPYSDVPSFAKSWKRPDDFWYVLEVEGGESYPDLCVRAVKALAEIKQKVEELKVSRDILIISHGTISKAIQVAHKGLPWEQVFNTPFFENCQFQILE